MNFLITFTAQYVFLASVIIFLIYVFYIWTKERKKFISFLLLSVISFALSLIVAKILGHFIYDPRPFVTEHVKPLFAHAPDNGFPSDHTLLTAAIASVVFAYNKKLGILLYVISLAIGVSRILAQIHHPLDIIGSFVIAIVVTYFSYLLLKKTNRAQD